MTDQFTPRTVAIVALASLVTGFVVVFGGGMLALRPRASVAAGEGSRPARPSSPSDAGSTEPTGTVQGTPPTSPSGSDGGGQGAPGGPGEPSVAQTDGGPTAGGSVRILPSAVSRCFDVGNPTPIPGATCDRMTALEQHFASKSAELATCTRGHGRLPLILDFRVSTAFVRAWGGPSSTVPDPGTVAACVRRVTNPLPLATMPHAHDRYVMVLPIEW